MHSRHFQYEGVGVFMQFVLVLTVSYEQALAASADLAGSDR